ncbi:MAG: pseudouridine synthase [Candidatus Moranbacteria bacterium]|nr:pseudouridine synthase [Candidatus Moranbacteria bacterium]MDD3964538.1 pseudouridine synthase [Candidatus Moranbacteria bacterium]
MTEKIVFPIRINRYLAMQGLATRRGADELVASGLVEINGIKAKLGDRVESTDHVDVKRDKKHSAETYTYVAYYKPRGIITHSKQEEYESEIKDISPFPNLFPMGRLDKASEGLILLTDDGRVTERLLHPRFAHEKEYLVTVREKVLPSAKNILESGIESEGELLSAKKVQLLGPHTLVIILTEGKKHQIRRMLDTVHLTVEKLVRTRIMGIHIGALKPGQSRTLKGSARASFLKSIDLKENI